MIFVSMITIYLFCEVLELHGYKNAKVTVSKEPWEDGFTVKFTWEIQTNADRIRAMTDEELLKMIYTIGAQLYNKTTEEWLEWLRKEPEDGIHTESKTE